MDKKWRIDGALSLSTPVMYIERQTTETRHLDFYLNVDSVYLCVRTINQYCSSFCSNCFLS